jgi:hypothetical protein
VSVHDLILEAMQKRLVVVATYHGHRRYMSPHALGLKNGRQKALLYQFAGGSDSGLDPDGSPANWRCVFLDAMTNVALEEGAWHTAISGHSRKQTCVDQVEFEIRN